jgi:lysophospholipase L1-like esterase
MLRVLALSVVVAAVAVGSSSASPPPTTTTVYPSLGIAMISYTGDALPLRFTTDTLGPPRAPVYQPPQRYYLALGDSMAYGFQPTKAHARPSSVDTGYVDLLAARLRAHAPALEVVNYGCPGESTVTFVQGGCDWLKAGGKLHAGFRGSQLAAAESFLRAHPGQVGPITLTLWGGDLFPLSEKGADARAATAAFGARLASLLRRLRVAAPRAEIIVSGAWDPEADRLARTAPLYRAADAAIRRAAAGSRARVADMFTALGLQRARLCRLTFYCSDHDPHPTDPGYRAMAQAFLAASGYR